MVYSDCFVIWEAKTKTRTQFKVWPGFEGRRRVARTLVLLNDNVSPLFPLSLKSKNYILDSRLAYNLYVSPNSVCVLLMQFHGH